MTALRKIQDANVEQERSRPVRIIPLAFADTYHQPTAKPYIDAVWAIAKSAFWLHNQYSRTEVRRIKQHIAGHFFSTKSSRATFVELCQRLAIEKLISICTKTEISSTPQTWLDIFNKRGFVNSNYHFQSIRFVRRNCPGFMKELKQFTYAMLAVIDEKPSFLLKRYRHLLLEGNQRDLLQLLYNSVTHFQNQL